MLIDFVWLQQQTSVDNNEAKLKKSVTEISHALNLKLEFSCQAGNPAEGFHLLLKSFF